MMIILIQINPNYLLNQDMTIATRVTTIAEEQLGPGGPLCKWKGNWLPPEMRELSKLSSIVFSQENDVTRVQEAYMSWKWWSNNQKQKTYYD